MRQYATDNCMDGVHNPAAPDTTVGTKSNLKAKLRVVSLFSSQPAFSPSMENRLTGK